VVFEALTTNITMSQGGIGSKPFEIYASNGVLNAFIDLPYGRNGTFSAYLSRLHGQCTGGPRFVCSSGSPICATNGTWECYPNACATRCPLVCDTSCHPPNPQQCTNNPNTTLECTSAGWSCVGASPIIIDTKGEGYHLTSASAGVQFRFFPSSPALQVAWTDDAFQNGFLVLDRNGNGVIDDGTELFGNITPQPPSSHPNGFLALAVYDLAENGGNANGVIDPGDAVYGQLRIWIDANHNGISEPEELHKLNEVGVFRIELKYHQSPDRRSCPIRPDRACRPAAPRHAAGTYICRPALQSCILVPPAVTETPTGPSRGVSS